MVRPGKKEAMAAEAMADSAESRAVQMACGSCAIPECHVRDRVAAAMRVAGEFSVSDEFVVVQCTNAYTAP